MASSSGGTFQELSFALVLPYALDWRTREIKASRQLWERPAKGERQTFAQVTQHPAMHGSALTHWTHPLSYHNSKKIASAAVSTWRAWWDVDEGDVPDSEPGPGQAGHRLHSTPWRDIEPLRLVAAERQEFADPCSDPDLDAGGSDHPQLGFAVLHFRCDEAVTAKQFERMCGRLRRPGAPQFGSLLLDMGLAASYSMGGFLAFDRKAAEAAAATHPPAGPDDQLGGARQAAYQRLHGNSGRGFLICHAVAAQDGLPAPDVLALHDAWSPVQAWSWLAAVGVHEAGMLRLPSRSLGDAERGTLELGSYHVRVAPDGLAAIGDGLLASPPGTLDKAVAERITRQGQADRTSMQLLLHGRLLDICLLALRQRAWLDERCESLAGTSRKGLSEQLDDLRAFDDDLARFRNTTWFTESPGRPEATRLLQRLQEVLNSPALLEEYLQEQQMLLHRADLERTQEKNREAEQRRDEREAEKQHREEQRRREEDRRHADDLRHQQQRDLAEEQRQAAEQRDKMIELVVALFAPMSIVLAMGALFSDPSPAHGVLWVVISVALSVVFALGVFLWRRSSQR